MEDLYKTENEQYVTFTYDDLDRILYRNVYKTDVPYTSMIEPIGLGGKGNINVLQDTRQPKKLIYQDVYTYKGKRNTAPYIKRVYQPVIDFSVSRAGSVITLRGSFTCQSKILASGFAWSTVSVDETVQYSLMPPDFFKGSLLPEGVPSLQTQVYKGTQAIGTKIHTINSGSPHYVKAFVQVETGTLFSKTLTV